MLCDFCSSPGPAWRYPAASFHDMFGGRAVEDWQACEDCHELMVADDRDRLARRSLRAAGVQMAVSITGRATTIRYCRDLHERFWKARLGAAFRMSA